MHNFTLMLNDVQYTGFGATYMISFSGKALLNSARQCQNTFYTYHNSMALCETDLPAVQICHLLDNTWKIMWPKRGQRMPQYGQLKFLYIKQD